jgi:uncharacterized repeat protein (TIGR03803 family)
MLRSSRVLSTTIAIAFLTACGGNSIPAAISGTAPTQAGVDAKAGHFRLLFAFYHGLGEEPNPGLIQYNGSLYGATTSGGRYEDGVLYELSITGKQTLLHSFAGTDGENPNGELLELNGNFYGTTTHGGKNGDGVVYVATPTGDVNALYNFSGSTDGANPGAGLIAVNGTTYGTTQNGGQHGDGTIFSIDTSGNEHVIYSFGASSGDGTSPSSTLLFYKQKLYGTTQAGGKYGGGTVFCATTKGKEKVVYSLGSGSDGVNPYLSNLTPFDGRLYGTTEFGGTHGHGVVFAIFPTGVARTLYNFGDKSSDGSSPAAGVISYRNALYGTTSAGGSGGQGTIFRVTKGGGETVLYAFSGNDGGGSLSRLLGEGPNLYGTLGQDGTNAVGTAFRFTP